MSWPEHGQFSQFFKTLSPQLLVSQSACWLIQSVEDKRDSSSPHNRLNSTGRKLDLLKPVIRKIRPGNVFPYQRLKHTDFMRTDMIFSTTKIWKSRMINTG